MAELKSAFRRGEFEIDGFSVNRDSIEERLLHHFGDSANSFVMNGVHRSYKLPGTTLGDGRFATVVFFSDGLITRLDLSAETHIKSWSEWSKAGQIAQRDKNSDWILRNIGVRAPHTFDWGSVYSIFDEKSGRTFIAIRFKPRRSRWLRRLWGLREPPPPAKRSP